MDLNIPVGGGSDLTGDNTKYASGAISYQAKAQGAMKAIVSFTKINAQILGVDGETGTIEAGKLADILLVRGNPVEDINLFKNHHANILFIMQGGVIHKKII